MMSFMKTVEKILAILEDRRLSMSALEAMAGLPRGRVQKWGIGQGEPSLSAAWRISRALDVPLEWLADDRATMPPPERELNAGESSLLTIYRALRLDPDEAVRALSMAAHATSEQPGVIVDVPIPREENGRERRRRSS